jgi:mono/diheme cytochrome c family protein
MEVHPLKGAVLGDVQRPSVKPAFRAVAGLLLCGLLTPQAQAQAVAQDPELARGEHIARFVCATCHVVARNQEFPPLLSKPAASFFDIANRPGVTAESLQHFVTTTHWDPDKLEMTMPALFPSEEQSRAVTRYILSLRTR